MTSKRKLVVAGIVAVLAAAIVLWMSQRGGSSSTTKPVAKVTTAGSAATKTPDERWPKTRLDPSKLARASVAGTIKNEDGAPIPGARVCAIVYTNKISQQLLPDPFCTVADAQGQYVIRELFADELVVSAMAKPYQPASYHPKGDRKKTAFAILPGEAKSGVDIVLRKGGVEITGTVSDLTGGPIAHAMVLSRGGWGDYEATPAVETDDKGAFSMWVRPGNVSVEASAEGYAKGSDDGKAPGHFEILLTPEGSLAGIVVDAASGQPVPGVNVEASDSRWGRSDQSDVTDEQGKFRISRLEPGRYQVTGQGPQGYGRAEGSTLVGLGQHVDGVMVKLYPAFRVSGRVLRPDKTTCEDSWLWLQDKDHGRSDYGERESDGTLVAHGLLPGTYSVTVGCSGFDTRDKYDAITIVDKNIDGLTWDVNAGATVRGKVLTKSGKPVERAMITARTVGGAARARDDWGGDTTTADGSYEVTGMREATYKLDVETSEGNPPQDGWKVDVKAGQTIEKDLVLEEGGTIKGLVVDADGKPVSSVTVRAFPTTNRMRFGFRDDSVRTNEDGTFQLDNLEPGDYRVYATLGRWSEDLRKPGSTDDDRQGEKATVVAGQTANVKLLVESLKGVIKGTVLDSQGAPVSDAFVVAARESDAAGAMGGNVSATRWTWDERPVLTSTDGKFTLTKLQPGKYTLRAHRKGGGEAVAEHVAVGSNATLQIKATGSIAGIAKRDGGAVEDLKIDLRDPKTELERYETYFRTAGAFTIKDLPAGTFTITATADGAEKQVTVTLSEGEQKTGVTIQLEPQITLTGRVVEAGTNKPVPGIRMSAESGKDGGGRFTFGMDDEDEQLMISGEDGKFAIKRAPSGVVSIRGFPKDYENSDYSFIQATRTVTGTGTVDIGDIVAIKRRLKKGEQAGDLGIHFKERPPGASLDEYVYEVSFVDMKGPAVNSGIKVGDIITSIDGVDVTGENAVKGFTLLRAPVGTKIELGLQRGDKVTIVLAAPQ